MAKVRLVRCFHIHTIIYKKYIHNKREKQSSALARVDIKKQRTSCTKCTKRRKINICTV